MNPQQLKYTESHEWVEILDENRVKVGITSHAISELTDLTYLEFNVEEGDEVNQGEVIAEVESVKTTSEVYAPVSGKVLEVNDNLPDMLDEMMESPYDIGWMIEIQLSDPAELDSLLSVKEYEETIEDEE